MPDTRVIIERIDAVDLPISRLRDVLTRHPRLLDLLRAGPGGAGAIDPNRLIITEPELLKREPDERSPFRAMAYDRITNRAVEVTGRLSEPDLLELRPVAFRPRPDAAELREAAAVLRADPGFAALAERPDVVIYQPMPPLADLERDDGTSVRRPTLGILDPVGSPRHRIVAVDLADGVVDWAPVGVDALTDDDCEASLPVGVESFADPGGPQRVRVRVLRDDQELWNLVVVRPRHSTPQTHGKGSGVELQQVHYRGRQVLYQAHVPILNVLYDDGTSYRDWQNQETPFRAVGSEPVGASWRLCSEPPATILEAGTDDGNFQGVALHYADGELRIVSELQAGWYRYVSDWRLRDDGVIKPRFGFAGTRNPRTCKRHQHHVYWRLDFDIEGAGRDVVERQNLFVFGRPQWTPRLVEGSTTRSVLHRSWRVRDKDTGRGYRIVPGLLDGSADGYGVADLWFLRYRPGELDDGVSLVSGSAAQTKIQIDKYVTGESIDGTDVVVWYGGHFLHDEQHPAPHQGHLIGPELRPINWD